MPPKPKAPPAPTPTPPAPKPPAAADGVALLDATPHWNAKLIRVEGHAVLATPEGNRVLPKTDPFHAEMPAGAWIRKIGPEFQGYLPEGAARAVWEVFFKSASSAAAVFADMRHAITGERR